MSSEATSANSIDSNSASHPAGRIGNNFDWERERKLSQRGGDASGDYHTGFNRSAADLASYRSASGPRLLEMLEKAVAEQWKLMLDISPHLNPSFARIEEMLSELASPRIANPKAANALAFVTAKEGDPANPNRVRYINYAPRGLPSIKYICEVFGMAIPAGMEEAIKADIERRAKVAGGDVALNGKAFAANPQTPQGRLEQQLAEALSAVWNPMILATPEMRIAQSEVERILTNLAELKDDRAKQALAFINEVTPESARTGRPILKNYAPRGLPAIREVYRLYGLEEPKDKVEAVVAAARKVQPGNGFGRVRPASA